MKRLKVGAAKACVTPPQAWFPFAKSNNGPKVTGVLHDLYTRAVVLDNGETRYLFLNVDCGPSPDAIVKRELSDAFGIPVENMTTTWTHNHSDGLKWVRNAEYELSREFYHLVRDAMFSAVREAIESLRDARWGFGEGKSYINVNRDKLGEDGHWIQSANFEAPSDKTLAVMKFIDKEGRLIAAVLNYACHATVAFLARDTDGGLKITGGFPGYASAYLERRYPDSIILWNSGAAGDQNPITGSGWPLWYNEDGTTEEIEPPDGTRYMVQRYLGDTHAIDALHAIEAITEFREGMEISSVSSYLTLPGHHPPEGLDHFTAYKSVYQEFRREHPEIVVNGRSLAELDRIEMVDEGESRMQMQLSLFDDVAWIGASGELYADIGFKLKEASPYTHTVVVTHTEGDAMFNGGYILSDDSAHHDTFQFYHTETRPGGNDKRVVDNFLTMSSMLTS